MIPVMIGGCVGEPWLPGGPAAAVQVYDVRWHPSHPACFASVDGEGQLGAALVNLGVAGENGAVQLVKTGEKLGKAGEKLGKNWGKEVNTSENLVKNWFSTS